MIFLILAAHLPPGLPSFVHTAAPYVSRWGYLGVALLVGIESLGLPLPGETTLITAAIFAGIGQLNIFWLVVVGTVAAVVGDNIGYAIGNFGGERLLHKFGKYIGITEARIEKLKEFFDRRGPIIVVVARFIEGLRQLNGIIAGMSSMRWATFLVFNIIGAAVWVTLWSTVGYFGGSQINNILRYETYVIIAAAVVVVALVARHVMRRRHKKAQAAAATAAAGDQNLLP